MHTPSWDQSGNYQYLRDSDGLTDVFEYYTSTTATDTSPGDVVGYLRREKGTGMFILRPSRGSRVKSAEIGDENVVGHTLARKMVRVVKADTDRTCPLMSEALCQWGTDGRVMMSIGG